MGIRIYNTLTRKKETFEPLDPQRITLYACGPTVYDYAHIGNARPAVVFDLLRRNLERHYPRVDYARNITDVDDKINASAASEGVSIDVISTRFEQAYLEDMGAIGVQPPTIDPHATAHIPQMIAMIEQLIDSGHAYAAEGHVLFAIDTFSEYGSLSRRDLDDMVAGARVEVAPYKRHAGDFVLWKPSVDPQPGWDSPWGWGRPGWHLECSAMAAEHLGETIDIHGGGQDLVFPHHENELAQSVCAHGGKPFARYWMHNGFVTADREKMSKSLGNTLIVHDLLKLHPGETLRYVLLSAHYRKPLDWSSEAIEQAQRTLDRMYAVLRDAASRASESLVATRPGDAFTAALDDDLGTPEALAEMNGLARRLGNATAPEDILSLGGELLADGELIGLLCEDPEAWLKGGDGDDDEAIDALVRERDAARAARDFARADALRDELDALGISLEDSPDGTRWRRGR
ncbi:cysteine--tRNA ligase [Marinihelvus fidelis]|uniref:Cysteine--tRNA ligase n=1 Tax=Marinihelvus fidelis TaxID=2613842 RepID=A0A5N0TBH0_9GAMM|nr:cysteine--tRNA ligase [Marinihelvus fidelis]KAA9132091.1 cysteine--tRNA ligase [Marinihelvus fidelis]